MLYLNHYLPVVCTFRQHIIYSQTYKRQHWLLLLNTTTLEATICTYDNWKEWQDQMHVLRRAAQNGGDNLPPDMGVPAKLSPSPPSRPAANSHALPVPADFGIAS